MVVWTQHRNPTRFMFWKRSGTTVHFPIRAIGACFLFLFNSITTTTTTPSTTPSRYKWENNEHPAEMWKFERKNIHNPNYVNYCEWDRHRKRAKPKLYEPHSRNGLESLPLDKLNIIEMNKIQYGIKTIRHEIANAKTTHAKQRPTPKKKQATVLSNRRWSAERIKYNFKLNFSTKSCCSTTSSHATSTITCLIIWNGIESSKVHDWYRESNSFPHRRLCY